MRKAVLFLFLSYSSLAQDSLKTVDLDQVVVNATRAAQKSGLVFTEIGKKELQPLNMGQDIPFLLNQLPSVVVSSDAGNGVGYTSIRIRGEDQTRINVTLNGIPYNDAESQGAYWVNLPDLSSSVQSIQVQRGVGGTVPGTASFGGSLNINTLQLNREAFGQFNLSAGNFATRKANLIASTGLLKKRWVLDGRISTIYSDGFVDRGASDLNSVYISGGYYYKNNFSRFNYFIGKQKTYQSWNGIPESLANGEREGFEAYVGRNRLNEEEKAKMWDRGRRFNVYDYSNQIDHYKQSHYQWINSLQFGEWRFSPTIFLTLGSGYFEEYKTLPDNDVYQTINGNEILEDGGSWLVRQKHLDNKLYGIVASIDREWMRYKIILGGGYSIYKGDHFGRVIASDAAFTTGKDQDYRSYEFYRYYGDKDDITLFWKNTLSLTDKLTAYLDVQLRGFIYHPYTDFGLVPPLNSTYKYRFGQIVNPRIGLNYHINDHRVYTSYGKTHREPPRQDIDGFNPVFSLEKLNDFELGYQYQSARSFMELNFYGMFYDNFKALTGRVNEVGAALREDVGRAHRLGVEWVYNHQISKKLSLKSNLTLSKNTIKEFKEVIANYDTGESVENAYRNTPISYSSRWIGAMNVEYQPIKKLNLTWMHKYVGKQYLDNTGSESRDLPNYYISNLSVAYLFKKWKRGGALRFNALINNIFDAKYSSNGYTYSYVSGGLITENFVYPQAGINFLGGLSLDF